MANLLQIIEKKRQQSEADRLKIAWYESAVLGEKVEIRKMKLTQFLPLIDKLEDAQTANEQIEAMNEIIFKHCPMFNENVKEAMEFYGASEPTELPALVFEEQLNEIKDLSDAISALYGIDKIKDDIDETVKN